MYDAIVVGARCAGSPAAMLLARRGYRVLLLDRAGFPSDTLSTHLIHLPGVARLKRWGLLDQVAGSNCPPIRQMIVDFGAFALRGSPPPADGVAEAYCPRRVVLDQILVEAAVAAGAELREHFTVKELIMDGARVTGIRGHSAGGPLVTEQAPIVIGADGLHSVVARAVQAPAYNVRPVHTCSFYSYWSDVPVESAEINPRPGRAIIAVPTNDGQTMIITFWPNAMFDRVRADIEGSFLDSLDLVPRLAERVRGGRRSERFRGTADSPNFYRRAYGPGWALVGDAGYHKDPVKGMGITDAFRDADLLAAAVDDGLSGRRPMQEALAEYERQRDEASLPMYEHTLQLARLEAPPPRMQRVFAALVHNQEQTNRYLGTIVGTVPISEFYAPGNLEAIVRSAPALNAVPAPEPYPAAGASATPGPAAG